MAFRVCFVCTGNICRSPAAHAVLVARLAEAGILGIEVDSCGLGCWHVEEPSDRRARAEGARRGLALNHLARTLHPSDFLLPGILVAMDRGHRRALLDRAPAGFDPARVVLLRDFDPASPPGSDVADPYYSGAAAFTTMFDVIEAAMPGLVEWLSRGGSARSALSLPPPGHGGTESR